MDNDNQWSSVEHLGHSIYVFNTQTWGPMIIDDMSNIKDMVCISGRQKHEEWCSCVDYLSNI